MVTPKACKKQATEGGAMSLLAPTNLVPGNLVPPLPSLLNSSLQTLQEGEENSVCMSVSLSACLGVCAFVCTRSGKARAEEKGACKTRSWRCGWREGEGHKVRETGRQVGPSLSSFSLVLLFLALLPLCSMDSSSPLFVVFLHSHPLNLVHTISTSHLHYLVQVGMLLFTNPLRQKVTKVMYCGRFLVSCDMNWAPREWEREEW